MNKKLFFSAILVMVLVFGMTVLGCGDTEDDTWSKVTRFSQVNGTWKAPSKTTVSSGGMKITANFNNYTITFDETEETMTANGSQTTTITGGNIAEIWPSFKQAMEAMGEEEGITVSANDSNHSIIMTYNNYTLYLTEEELAEAGFQINQNKKKLKATVQGIEIIYTKQ
jgi:hypothetical protein